MGGRSRACTYPRRHLCCRQGGLELELLPGVAGDLAEVTPQGMGYNRGACEVMVQIRAVNEGWPVKPIAVGLLSCGVSVVGDYELEEPAVDESFDAAAGCGVIHVQPGRQAAMRDGAVLDPVAV